MYRVVHIRAMLLRQSDIFDIQLLPTRHHAAREFLRNMVQRTFVAQPRHLKDVLAEHQEHEREEKEHAGATFDFKRPIAIT
jgi:hypothetical protein